ncbi:MAG: CDP-alcohol phosphatidyltransferase family protein [Pseudomonadales bacterium]|nr:CDP-alcohol phosphatidyltransferase family protein [Pseudomonadales bacterium]
MDYFNHEEREKQKKFSNWRDKHLKSLLKALTSLNVSPNAITIIGVLLLAIAATLSKEYIFFVAIFLILYVAFDGIDGPLARYQSKAHTGGALIDISADQMGVVILPIAAIYHFNINGISSVLFSTGYVVFIAFSIFLNEKSIKTAKYVRVKYPFYVLYFLELVFNFNFLDKFMMIFGFYYWIMIFLTLRVIYNYYDTLNKNKN